MVNKKIAIKKYIALLWDLFNPSIFETVTQ